jgi:hypothetical protein
MLEETPREKLLERVAVEINDSLSYRDLLAALQLAGVRNVEPRPSVGHKFHAVLVVNSAHLASISSPAEHRWLPIFWAIDHFKAAQARDVQERGDWTMAPVLPSSLPPAHKAKSALTAALDDWNEGAADGAVAVMARTAGANDVYEMLFQYGARDFRSIGHKAIYAANSFRTLGCIGWQHAEPILRSLVYAMLMHEGTNPAKRDADADRPYRRNQERVQKIGTNWRDGKIDEKATTDLLSTFRTGTSDDAGDQIVELLGRGIAPQTIFDAMHLAAGELLIRQPGIVALHAVTTTNALQFAFHACASDRTRQLVMLQNAAFLPMFRAALSGRGRVKETKITDLTAAEATGTPAETIETIFADLRSNPQASAQRVLGFLSNSDDATRAKQLIDAARLLIFLKGNNAHDYKFSSAVLEDYYNVSPRWRATYLAANMVNLRGSQLPDNSLVKRTRAALGDG